jgi:NAD(P)H-flavin reductase/ferredoxin
MRWFLPGRRTVIAEINDRAVTMQPRETLLQAALREGIPFPHSCRVGGCATCKCRLVEGKVTELTESGYILSDKECREGFILACQSVPRTDIRIQVRLAAKGTDAVSTSSVDAVDGGNGVDGVENDVVRGRVIGQDRLTHDITRLRVQLDSPIKYRAGQFANLSLASLPGTSRSYSFATPASPDGQVSFLVRKVPGGRFSTLVNDTELTGENVLVGGPAGNCCLRPSAAPLLLVAGGSGLAPILAILQDALATGAESHRPATLLFGARTEHDLYALAEIQAIASQWRGSFRFIPVLSEASDDSPWTGERGWVTDHIPGVLDSSADVHAYLCGPPPMIDTAETLLKQHGVASAHIHADRFLTQADGIAALERTESAPGIFSALHYLKFFLFHAVGILSLGAILLGGQAISAGFLALLAFYLVGDAISGDDVSTPRFDYPAVLTVQLWLALPLLSAIVFAAIWAVSPGDPFGFGDWITRLTVYDVLSAREKATFGNHYSLLLMTGLLIGMIGTITAHELTHRTSDKFSMFIGRWLLAFSFDTIFSIEHVYGHHRYVSTEADPATAPRGRNVYHHIVASTIRGNISAWHIEVQRLRRKGFGRFSWRNAFIRGYLMSFALVGAAWWMGGWKAAGFFVLCGLWGKSLLEIVNYMEHYGMVRHPDAPVAPRHSWNTNKRLSSWSMFNLTRHSHHHAQGEVPYQDLKPYPHAPMMIGGYLTTIVVAMVPPLWHRLMTPRLLAWDRDHANAEERRLAARANARSGIPALLEANDSVVYASRGVHS